MRATGPVWSGLLWGLALLGLLLLPSDYRAGGEAAHGHALMHLWLDAADGAVHHHHAANEHSPARVAAWNWLDPTVAEPSATAISQSRDARADVAEHQDSILIGAGVHLLVASVSLMTLAVARWVPGAVPCRAPAGQVARVLLPPPRWALLAG